MLPEWFRVLWGDGDAYGEIRCLSEGRHPQSHFFPVSDSEGIAKYALNQDSLGGWDVYAGVAPRLYQRGTNDSVVSSTHVLWADVDAKNRVGGKYAALAGVRMLQLKPSIIVDSGHGFHLYWLLRAETDWDLAQQAMKALAREAHGDAVHDKARILRVPGTTNRKDPANPVPVRLLYWDTERKYRITDFPTIEEPPVYPHSSEAVSRHLDLPTWLAELIAEGAPKGERSEASFKVCLWMIRYGREEDEIREVFRTSTIGEKYREKGRDGDRWLKMTMQAARKADQ